MATYQYKCEVCGSQQEIQKPMGSDWTPVCCEKSMQQVYYATPTVFKTDGFYKTGG